MRFAGAARGARRFRVFFMGVEVAEQFVLPVLGCAGDLLRGTGNRRGVKNMENFESL